jgi:mannose-6-phosphate isomerase-like protein (cupin superfamily)
MQAQVWTAAEVEKEVKAALAAGKSGPTLLGKEAKLGYGIIVTDFHDRKPKPELHEQADDVYYIIAGKGELTIGGELVVKEAKGPGEWTAQEIAKAEKVTVRAGDVVSIPRGVPHMMGCPGGAVKYFVVKVY